MLAVDKVSFSFCKGRIVGLIETKGGGKTTILKKLMNLLEKDRGTINAFGNKKIGMIGEL